MQTCMLTFMHLFRPLRYLSRWTDNGTLSLNADVGEGIEMLRMHLSHAQSLNTNNALESLIPPNGAELSKLPINVYFYYEFSAISRKLCFMFIIDRYGYYCERFWCNEAFVCCVYNTCSLIILWPYYMSYLWLNLRKTNVVS